MTSARTKAPSNSATAQALAVHDSIGAPRAICYHMVQGSDGHEPAGKQPEEEGQGGIQRMPDESKGQESRWIGITELGIDRQGKRNEGVVR